MYWACHPRLVATMSFLPLKYPCVCQAPAPGGLELGGGLTKVREMLEFQSILEGPEDNRELTVFCKLKKMKDKGIHTINMPI